MDKLKPSDKSIAPIPDRIGNGEISDEVWARARAATRAEEEASGKRHVDINGKPVIVVDRPIDL